MRKLGNVGAAGTPFGAYAADAVRELLRVGRIALADGTDPERHMDAFLVGVGAAVRVMAEEGFCGLARTESGALVAMLPEERGALAGSAEDAAPDVADMGALLLSPGVLRGLGLYPAERADGARVYAAEEALEAAGIRPADCGE